MAPRYQTAQAFRHAPETRLMQYSAQSRVDVMRLRRMVAFDRLLARLFGKQGEREGQEDREDGEDEETLWLLKGGYAMELRLGYRARATRDIDLTLPDFRLIIDATDTPGVVSNPIPEAERDQSEVLRAIQKRLQEDVDRDLGDWFVFRVGAPMVEQDAPPHGGARFPVETLLANRRFIIFHLDVGVGDTTVSPPEWIAGHDGGAVASEHYGTME